jgi:hypothetical protein
MAVALDPTEDVLEFLLPVERLIVARPPAGPNDNSVPDGTANVALAVGIRDAVRRASRTNG